MCSIMLTSHGCVRPAAIALLLALVGTAPVAQQGPPDSTPMTMGQLVQLASTGGLTPSVVQRALTLPEPGVRAVAARIIGAERLLSQAGPLMGALAIEEDQFVAREQVLSLLTLGTPETIAAAETHLGRLGRDGLVTYSNWLGRTNPDRLAERFGDLATRLDQQASLLGEVTLQAIGQHPDRRDALIRAIQKTAPGRAWYSVVLDALLSSPPDATYIREALRSPNAAVREQAIWAIVGRLAFELKVNPTVLDIVTAEALTPSMPLSWEQFGREIIVRSVKKSKGADRSEFIAATAAKHPTDGYRLLGLNVLHNAERAVLRKTLNITTDERQSRTQGAVEIARGDRRPTMRLFPLLWPGFIASVLTATGCDVPREPRFGGALVTFGADGRPTAYGVDNRGLPPPCVTAMKSLRHVTLADTDEVLTPGTPQWHILPIGTEFVACTSRPRASTPPPAEHDSGLLTETPRKTRDVRPSYPSEAHATRTSGVVVVEAVISMAGCIDSAKVIRGVSTALDVEGLNAVSQWRYSIPRVDNQPAPVIMNVYVNFTRR